MKKVIIIIFLLLELFIFSSNKILLLEERNTINICLYNYVPSMFFSIFISNYLYLNNFEDIIPNFIINMFRKININKKEISIILLSIISGYPNNIKLLNNSNNEYLIYSTNYINPIFLIMTINNIYLKNNYLCLIVLLCHYLTNIIIFLIYKNNYKYNEYKKVLETNTYTKSLIITIKTLSIIISNLLFITLLITLLKLIIKDSIIKCLLIGLIEFSNGLILISSLNINIFNKGLFLLIIISFSSLSIFLQSISLNNKIKSTKFLLNKILSTILSILIYIIINVIIQVVN